MSNGVFATSYSAARGRCDECKEKKWTFTAVQRIHKPGDYRVLGSDEMPPGTKRYLCKICIGRISDEVKASLATP